ncbi:antibiotic biosynthesis monooxygenase family protein [Bogoriella caseilytica]|uniref:Heme-degrading monooxygenase HmoA n=1 Tax=Bogoriella caseilytica TaxID=56055 RepID=A0A3N2BCV5_9MICO|nr:antibiotic biosynthesis monooxygenase [Bogoriella caseilytica]ROR73052.1 heme-degrading monooxygenase HmoA [Bogoriella caseilytica]
MTVIKINAIDVPAGSGDELAHRFAARAGSIDGVDGFLGFELLKPTDERSTWLVLTRWRDDAAFEAWRDSAAFGESHRHGSSDGAKQRPVGTSAQLWSYEIAGGSTS